MTRSRPSRSILLAAALVGSLALGACSSSDPTPGPTGTTAGTTPGTAARAEGGAPGTTGGSVPGTSSSTSVTTAPATTTSTAGTDTTLAGGPTSSVVVSPDNKPFCDRVAAADQEFSDLNTTTGDEVLPRMQQTFAELVVLAPAEIRPDVETFARLLGTVTTFDELLQLETPELTAASDRLTAWTEANCGG